MEIIKVVLPELYIFFWIPASTAEAVAVILNETKIFFFDNGTSKSPNLLTNDSKNP